MPAELDEIRIRLRTRHDRPTLLAHVGLRYGDLGLTGLKIVRTRDGRIRVLMPDMPVRRPCVACDLAVPITHKHCHRCGERQPFRTPEPGPKGEPHKYVSVVFPLSHEMRARIESAVLHRYLEVIGVGHSRAS